MHPNHLPPLRGLVTRGHRRAIHSSKHRGVDVDHCNPRHGRLVREADKVAQRGVQEHESVNRIGEHAAQQRVEVRVRAAGCRKNAPERNVPLVRHFANAVVHALFAALHER